MRATPSEERPMSFPNSTTPELVHSRPVIKCAKCGGQLFMPERSEYVDEHRVRYLWKCQVCVYTFETTVLSRAVAIRKYSFSYGQLMSGKINRTKLQALANAGKLNEETLARIGHVGRFYQCISKACPNPNLKISDVLTGDELQKFWNETADEGVTIGQCPLVH